MKAKIKNELNFLNYYIGNNLVLTLSIILFVLTFIYSYYIGDSFSTLCSTPNFIDGVIFFFKDTIFIIILFLLPMLIVAISVVYNCEKLGSSLLRFKTKKEYINYLISSCFKANTIYFFILVFIVFVAVFCLINDHVLILYISDYKTLNILYLIVYLFKILFIGQCLSISSILLIKAGNKIIPALLNVFIYCTIIMRSTNQEVIISSILEMPLLMGKYLEMLNYSSFVLELMCFTIFAILLLILMKIIYIECNKRIRKVGDI